MKYFAFLLLPLTAFGQVFEADTVRPRELIMDQDSLHMDLSFTPEEGIVHGTIHLFVSQTTQSDSLWLDAKPSITVESDVLWNGEPVEWKRKANGIAIFPVEENWDRAVIELTYTARPFKGVYFNGWDDPSGKAKRQIFTQGQGIDHRHWLPHVDAQNDKLKTSMSITFNSDYRVLGNGNLVKKEEVEDHLTTWTYAMDHPHSSYLIAFVIGEYDETVVGESPFRANYFYTDIPESYPTTYYENEKVWNYLNERIGYPFAWSAYRQAPVANFPHGAMENTCMTIFSEVFIADELSFEDRNYTYVNAHELAHHWFGDLVTVPSSHDFWLHEGFATYYQMEAQREVFGDEEYTYEWMKAMRQVNEANATDAFPLQHGRAGSSRFYQLGALTLRALEHEVGTEVFDRAVLNYLHQNEFGLVVTSTFKEAVEKECDCKLDDFFEAFVENPHSETISVKYDWDSDEGGVVVSAKCENRWGDPLPITKLQVRVWTSEFDFEDQFIELEDEDWEEQFHFEEKWTVVEFDPYHHYPVNWKMELPDSLAVAMAFVASPYSQSRIVSSIDLESEFFKDNGGLMLVVGPQCTRDSIMQRAADERPDGFIQLMHTCMSGSDENSLGKFFQLLPKSEINDEMIEASIPMLYDTTSLSDATVQKIAMALIGANSSYITDVIEVLDTRSGGLDHDIDLLCAYLTTMVKGRADSLGIPRLLDFAGPSYPNDVRQNAWEYLAMLKYTEEDLREIQYAALASRHRHLRNAAVRVTKEYLANMNRNREIREIRFALRDAHPDDIARVERILGIELKD